MKLGFTVEPLDTNTMQALETMLEAVAERAVAKALARGPEPLVPMLTQNELAAHLKVTVRTVYAMRHEGMPTYFVGDSPRFDLEEVKEWMKRGRGSQ